MGVCEGEGEGVFFRKKDRTSLYAGRKKNPPLEDDEEAYAFLSDANKPLWVQTAVDAAALVGAHRDGPYMKQTEERYRDLTTVHVQLGYIAIPKPPPPKHDDDDLADLQGLAG